MYPYSFFDFSFLPYRRLLSLAAATGTTVAAWAGLLLLAGCGGETKPRTPADARPEATSRQETVEQEAFQNAAGTRAAALQVLDSLQRGALRGAFGTLSRLSYTRHVRTEQLGPRGQVHAFEERTTRYRPGGERRVLSSDSAGTFDFGMLGRFVSTDVGPPPPDLMQQALPEELPFLSQRNRYAFQYRLLPDTALAGTPARVVVVRVRPGPDGARQAIRQARLYLDKDTHQLVALQMHRVQHALLFDEDTHQYVRIRPAPDRPRGRSGSPRSSGAWVPAETRFQTNLRLPLRPTRRFRSSASYAQYRPVPG